MIDWRYSQKTARFFIFDARLGMILLFFLMHIRWWTFLMVILVIIGLWWMERRGLRVDAAMRMVRCGFANVPSVIRKPYKPSFERYLIDYHNSLY